MKKGDFQVGSANKYVPVHRRRAIAQDTACPVNSVTDSKQPIIGDVLNSRPPILFSSKDSSAFTSHALTRLQQRRISDSAIQGVWQSGEKLKHKESVTHIDETTQMVMAKNGKVITVGENKRNTRFDLLRISKDQEQSLIKEARFKNNDHAMCELAELYLSGKLGNREVQKAYHWLLKAANKRNSHAMCLLSQMYERGDLGTVNPNIALEWMEKAADRNNRYALAILGQRYLEQYLKIKGSNKVKEQQKIDMLEKAKHFLERSASKGSTRAMWQIAEMYQEGWCGEKNLPKAIEIYTKAAKLGSPASLDSLNDLVLKGAVSAENFEAILEEASHLIVRTSGGLAIDIGLKQIKRLLGENPRRGFDMIKKVAQRREGNHDEAIRVLARCYRDGEGCESDLSLSQYWFWQLKALYEKAAQQGNVQAMHDLGRLFLKGSLGEIDLEKAEHVFIQAAQTGDIRSICYLGRLYWKGCLGDKEPVEGIGWIHKAIELWTEHALKGDIEAMTYLKEIYLDKALGFKDYQKAVVWLRLSAEHGDGKSMLSLLKLYLNGKLGKNDITAAMKWIENLVKQSRQSLKSEGLLLLKKYLRKEQPNRKKKSQGSGFRDIEEQTGDGNDANQSLIGSGYCVEYSLKPQEKSVYTDKIKVLEREAYKDIFEAAEQGNLSVISLLADAYYGKTENLSLMADHAEAIRWYRKLAETEHLGALTALATLYQEGYFPKKDVEETVNPWVERLQIALHKRAGKEPHVAFILGKLYKRGNLLPRHMGEAARWLCFASCCRYVPACPELDDMLKFKEWSLEEKQQIVTGVLQNQNPQEKPYRVGRILGDIYSQGIFTQIDNQKALFWYERVAVLDNGIAMCRLGKFYQTGRAGEINLIKAIELYNLSAQQGNQEAIECLVLLNCSNERIEPNAKMVIESCLKQVELLKEKQKDVLLNSSPKDPQLMYHLGEKYRKGDEERVKDPLLAARWFRKAIKKGHMRSAYELGEMYASGELGEKVRSVAVNFYKKAAKNNHVKAMRRLFSLYTEGFLVKINLTKANKWKCRLEKSINEKRRATNYDFNECFIPWSNPYLIEAILVGARQVHPEIPVDLNDIISIRRIMRDILLSNRTLYYKKITKAIHEMIDSILHQSFIEGISGSFKKRLMQIVDDLKIYQEVKKKIIKKMEALLQERHNKDLLNQLRLEQAANNERWEKHFNTFIVAVGYQEYCYHLMQNKKWMGSLELEIVAQLLKIRIEIYQDKPVKSCDKFIVKLLSKENVDLYPNRSIYAEEKRVIHILCTGNNKYYLLNATENGLRHYYHQTFLEDSVLELLKKEFSLGKGCENLTKPQKSLLFLNKMNKKVPMCVTEPGVPVHFYTEPGSNNQILGNIDGRKNTPCMNLAKKLW